LPSWRWCFGYQAVVLELRQQRTDQGFDLWAVSCGLPFSFGSEAATHSKIKGRGANCHGCGLQSGLEW
jgi:hypothetical protein